MAHQQLNDWANQDEVCYFQVAFPLNTTSKSGEGHPGSTEHYVNGLLTHLAMQLCGRLAFPSYRGSLINPKEPGSPETWASHAYINPAVPPTKVSPGAVPARYMLLEHLPVSDETFVSDLFEKCDEFCNLFLLLRGVSGKRKFIC